MNFLLQTLMHIPALPRFVGFSFALRVGVLPP
jgi:hypothetical protein